MKTQSQAFLGAAAALTLLLGSHGPAHAADTATVDPTVQYQTFQGWGTSLAWWAKVVGGFPEPIRSDYMEKAFDPVKGLGLNVVRYNIGGGENPEHSQPGKEFLSFRAAVPGYEPEMGHWDWTADANQRWVLKDAIRRGANQAEAFSNSPPWWMTHSGSVTGNVGGEDNLKPEADGQFANYLATVVKHFHDQWGVTFRDVEPLNEPSAYWWKLGGGGNRQEGCRVAPAHQNEVIKATGAALARLGMSAVPVSASDESVIADANHTTSFYDAAALGYLNKINTHSYGGGDRTQFSSYALSHGKDLWMSEYGDGDGSGISLSQRILEDMNGLHPTAWVYWQFVDGGGWGLLTNPLDSEAHTDYGVNKKYWVMAQYSRYLRPGCRFVAVTDRNALAALDPKTNTLVIVVTNPTDAEAPLTYNLSGFTRLGTSVASYRTSPTEDAKKQAALKVAGRRLVDTLPAKSVTTYLIAGTAYTGPMALDYRRFYSLANAATGLVLDVSDSGSLVQKAGSGGESQQWTLRGLGAGDYKLVNRRSGQVVDVNQSSKEAGAALLQYGDNGGDNQVWHLTAKPGGTYTFVNRSSGMALDVTALPSGAALTQNPVSSAKTQQWRLRSQR